LYNLNLKENQPDGFLSQFLYNFCLFQTNWKEGYEISLRVYVTSKLVLLITR